MKNQIQQSVEEFKEKYGGQKFVYATEDVVIYEIKQSLKANTQAVIDMLEGMKTDERKVATFGEWQAETYEDKMLVNAVIQEAIDKLKAEITE